jgi:hypothetical protein
MVRIDKELAESYRIRAESEDRSLAAEIRQALRRDPLRRDLLEDGESKEARA